MRIDSHIHLDRLEPAVARDALAEADYRALVPGIDVDHARLALDRWGDRSNLVLGAALHPWYLPDDASWSDAFAALHDLAQAPEVGVVGETGLDHYRFDEPERARIEEAFRLHLQIAGAVDKPVVIHCVRAHSDCARVLKESSDRPTAVVHAFSGSPEEAAAYARLGVYVGIGAAVTRQRSRRVRRAAAQVPLGQLLLETDAPFMAVDGGERGTGIPRDIDRVAETVAELRGVSVTELWSAVGQNFERFVHGQPPAL